MRMVEVLALDDARRDVGLVRSPARRSVGLRSGTHFAALRSRQRRRGHARIRLRTHAPGEGTGMAVTDGHAGATGRVNHHVVPATADTVHWGYFSRSLKPVLSVELGGFVTIEKPTHHAYD